MFTRRSEKIPAPLLQETRAIIGAFLVHNFPTERSRSNRFGSTFRRKKSMPDSIAGFEFISNSGAEYSLLFIIFVGSLTFLILAGNPNDEDTTTRYQRNGSLAHRRTGVAGFDRRSTCSRRHLRCQEL
nr:hypothetical protein [Porphyromonas gulae]